MADIPASTLSEALATLLEEIHIGPANPKTTWAVTNAPDSGILGTLSSVSAGTASRSPGKGMATIAAHASHLLFALRLAAESLTDPDAYKGADWDSDWKRNEVDEKAWREIRAGLKNVHEALHAGIAGNLPWNDANFLKGALAVIAHGAYHLGAIRQILRRFEAGG